VSTRCFWLTALCALVVLTAGSLAAQSSLSGTAAGLVQNFRARSEASGVTQVSGTALGFTGSLRFRRFELGVQYAEGTLQPADQVSESRDLVEGALALRFVGTPWLSVEMGPRVRHYATTSGAERWVTWRLGGRVETAVVGTSVRGYAMLWRGLGLDVNVPPGSGSTRGGEVGVTVNMGPGPLWFTLGYGIDHAQVRDAARSETVEILTLTAGLRRR